MEQQYTILQFVTSGVASFLTNSLGTIKRCGINLENVVIVHPQEAVAEVLPLASRFGCRLRPLESFYGVNADTSGEYVPFGSDRFRELMRIRFEVIRQILREIPCLIYADVDVAWLRDPRPYLSQILRRFSWACQTEPIPSFPPPFCLGFFAVRNDPLSMELIDRYLIRLNHPDLKKINDQTLFQRLVREEESFANAIFPLPEGLFPTGLMHQLLLNSHVNQSPVLGTIEPFVFHANWTVGLEGKEQLLKSCGCWISMEP